MIAYKISEKLHKKLQELSLLDRKMEMRLLLLSNL